MLLACNKPAGIKLKDSLCDFCWAEIWLPIIVMPHKIGLATLQRLSGLLPSSASPEDKMEVAEMVADSRTRNVVAETKQKELKKKLKLGQHLKHPSARFVGVSQRMHTPRPKALNAIKQEKLASRQEMKAVMNALSHVGMSMDSFFPKNPLTPKVRDMEERQVLELNSQKFAFIYNKHTGQTRWDVPMHSATQDIRLVLCADQGSPLHTCFQFLAFSGASIGLIRDELPPGGNMVSVVCIPLNPPATQASEPGPTPTLRHKLHAHQGRVTSCTPVVKRFLAAIT